MPRKIESQTFVEPAAPVALLNSSGFFTLAGAAIGTVIPIVGTVAGGLIGAGLDLVISYEAQTSNSSTLTPEVYPETTLVEEIDPDFVD